ncbi:MAG: Exodeoxyribonuclease 7 large subunit [Verrucomicrobiales bacterium]|nr:Exodeoxyribonuclease 7 large subunit [Verrucomicrobiales bacterium]
MARETSNQWDFSDAKPTLGAARTALTVQELTGQIKKLLERHITRVWVKGEITNLRNQSSGHAYFTLKDAGAQLSCVLFRGEAIASRSVLQDGVKVNLQGDITVYEARGQYQLRVTACELEGVGALQAAFEQLKARLAVEGLFAPERKRPLPRFPQRVGLVTSPTGAAIKDVLHVIQRRHAGLKIILAPARVQGQGAAPEIAQAIASLNDWNDKHPGSIDLILVTRGGGSLEDLWAFNEEIVARAIFVSKLPVVSAVGHEIDFTISDFVADLRAATPSAAAEIITEGVFSSCKFISQVGQTMKQRVLLQLGRKQLATAQWAQRLQRKHPRRVLQERSQYLDELLLRLYRCCRHDLKKYQEAAIGLTDRLKRLSPQNLIRNRKIILDQAALRLHERTRHSLFKTKQRLQDLDTRLRLLSPSNVVSRGYSITLDAASGKVIRHPGDTVAGQKIITKLAAGEIKSTVSGSRKKALSSSSADQQAELF